MKISKVDHTKAAVSSNEGGTRGILYRDPMRGGKKELDLSFRISGRNSAAQKLYNPFTSEKKNDKKMKEHPYKDIYSNLSKFIKDCLKKVTGI